MTISGKNIGKRNMRFVRGVVKKAKKWNANFLIRSDDERVNKIEMKTGHIFRLPVLNFD